MSAPSLHGEGRGGTTNSQCSHGSLLPHSNSLSLSSNVCNLAKILVLVQHAATNTDKVLQELKRLPGLKAARCSLSKQERVHLIIAGTLSSTF